MSLGLSFLDVQEDPSGAPQENLEKPEPEEEAVEAEDAEAEGDQSEDPTEEDESDADDSDEDLEVIDLDGEEVTLDDIRKWKSGNLREQDYTKKTMALAEDRKAVTAKLNELNDMAETLSAGEADIKKALAGDLDDIDLKSLRDEDYPEYLKVKETINERESVFDDLKQKAIKAREAYIGDQSKMLSSALGWDDKSKSEADINAFKEMAADVGIGADDARSLVSAKVMEALIDYARLKKQAKAKPPKAKSKKVSFKKSSGSPQSRSKPKSTEERLNSFFE